MVYDDDAKEGNNERPTEFISDDRGLLLLVQHVCLVPVYIKEPWL